MVVDPEIVHTNNTAFAKRFLRFVKGWRYEPPPMRDGEPVAVRVMVASTYNRDVHVR